LISSSGGVCVVIPGGTTTTATTTTNIASTSSNPSTSTVPDNINEQPSESTDNVVIIIPSVAGVVVIVLVISVVLFVWLRKRKQRSEDDEDAPQEMHTKSTELDPDVYLQDVVIKGKLGSGNFGEVYKGLWQGTTEVALKSLSGSDNPEVFMHEAKILQSLNHANVIRCYGLHIVEQKLYIVMKFAPYGSVNTYLQKQENLPVTALLDM
jgi:hypothetical protein